VGRVSGAGDVPATAAAHAGVGHVDKLHKGDQGAANRRHAKGLEAGALAEDRTKLLIRGVGRKISNVQGEGWRISRARGAGGGGKRGCSVRLGPIVPSTVCRTAVRAVCLALVPGVQLVSQCGHGDGVRGDTCSTVEEQQAGAGPWELEGGYAGSNIFIILAITTSCRAVPVHLNTTVVAIGYHQVALAIKRNAAIRILKLPVVSTLAWLPMTRTKPAPAAATAPARLVWACERAAFAASPVPKDALKRCLPLTSKRSEGW
jgi:hypothetical protein